MGKTESFRIKELGFTLVELILVIGIVGVLVAVLLTVIDPAAKQKLARDAIRKDQLAQLSRAVEAYYVGNSSVLPAADGNSHFSTDGSPPEDVTGAGWIPVDFSQELKILLTDPVNNGQYFYRYYADPSPGSNRFKLDAALEADFEAVEVDGGVDPNRYEVGTDKTLLPP